MSRGWHSVLLLISITLSAEFFSGSSELVARASAGIHEQIVYEVCSKGPDYGCRSVRGDGRHRAGMIDADLGGGVLKQRIARQGGGKSGGFRTIILTLTEVVCNDEAVSLKLLSLVAKHGLDTVA